ncbi:MAG: LysR family transcriptional regulator [Pseudomonadota bacterium]
MQDLDLDLLRCFVTVAELRNFTAAGIRLGRSQSAVSIRIKKLEDALGARLLERSNQDVRLTDRGSLLLPKAKSLLADSERLLAEMRGPKVSGRLRIGLLEYIAPQKMPDLMAAMARKLPEAELSFRVGLSSQLRSALRTGEIDLALALHDPESGDALVVGTDSFVWVESADGAQAKLSEPIDLCLLPAPCIYRETAFEALSNHGLKHREVLTASSVQSVRDAVASGLGMSLLGASCLGHGIRPAQQLNSLGALPTVQLALHGNDPRQGAVAETLSDLLADTLPRSL